MADTMRTVFTPRTWAGIWTVIITAIVGIGGVQVYVGDRDAAEPAAGAQAAADHNTIVALVELAKSHDKAIAANRDGIAGLAAIMRENQVALSVQIDRLSVRIDRLLEQQSQP